MKSFLKQIDEGFESLDSIEEEILCTGCNGEGCPMCESGTDIEEASTSAGAGPYNTPKAFAPTTNNKKATASTGMTLAPKGSLNTLHTEQYNRVQEAMDTKYEHLIEGYKSFALGNPGSSPTRTVNSSIREVAKQLKKIEETINHTIRLKTESGIAHSGFTKGTLNAVRKISERLIKISERVRSLGE